MLPSIGNTGSISQSLFLPIATSQTEIDQKSLTRVSPEKPSTTTKPKLHPKRSYSALKPVLLRQQQTPKAAMYSNPGASNGLFSPVKATMAKQTSTSNFRLNKSKLSPVRANRRDMQSKKLTAVSVFDPEAISQAEKTGKRSTYAKFSFSTALSQVMDKVPQESSPRNMQSEAVRAGSVDDKETEITESTASRSTPTHIVIKKRGEVLPSETQSRTKTSAKSKMNTGFSDQSEYFRDLVKLCTGTLAGRRHESEDSSLVISEVQTYFVGNHRNMQMMKNDFIVERPAPVTYERKYPDRKLLLLDLDETLLHCSGDVSQRGFFDQTVDFINHEGIPLTGVLNIRPYARQFLENTSKMYEIVIFTASMKYYADRLIKILDPKRKFISEVFYRDTCCLTRNDKRVKDLTVFQNIPLSDMILVDNNMYCLWPQPQNGIPILNFEHNRLDRELVKLEQLLTNLKDRKNPSGVIRDMFKVGTMANCGSLAQYLLQF